MAVTDYYPRGSGPICPVATMVAEIRPDETTFPIQRFKSQSGLLPDVGSAVLVGDEIMKLTARSANSITVERGCADTIPQWHSPEDTIWFFGNATGSDRREYLVGEEIGVKVLMKTSGGSMGVQNAPALPITFTGRQYLPYPPGNMKANGIRPWDEIALTYEGDAEMVFTWAHRDRVTQADILIPFTDGNIGPEPGTTYTVEIYFEDTLIRTASGITGTSYTYSMATAVADLGLTDNVTEDTWVHALIYSVRDGMDSMQKYDIYFTVNTMPITGWGGDFGNNWGG